MKRKPLWLSLAAPVLLLPCICGALRADTVLTGTTVATNAVGVAAILATNASFTIEGWIKPLSNNRENVIWAQYGAGAAGRCDLCVKSGRIYIFIGGGKDAEGQTTQSETLYATPTVANGVWTHVAFTRDFTTRDYAFYVNGQPAGSGTSAGTQPLQRRMTVGGLYAQIGEANSIVHGALADVRVWTVVRSAEEISANYQRRLRGDEENLMVYLPFNESSGNTTTERVSGMACVARAPWAFTEDPDLALAAAEPQRFRRGAFAVPNGLGFDTDFKLTGTAFTLEGWVNFTNCTKKSGLAYQYPGTGRLSFEVNANESKYTCWFNGKSLQSSEVPDGWGHVALVRNGAELKFYLNGQEDTTGTGFYTGEVSQGVFFHLLGLQGTSVSFLGGMREFRAWTVARTAAEIQANMHRRLTAPQTGLVGSWPLDEGVSTKVVNRVTGAVGSFPQAPSWLYAPVPLVDVTDVGEMATAAALTGDNYTLGWSTARIAGTNFTFEAWVRPRSYRPTDFHAEVENQILRQYWSGVGRTIFGLYQGRVGIFVGDCSEGSTRCGWAEGDTVVLPGEWTHIAVTREGGTLRFYRNGEPDGVITSYTEYPPSATDLQLGVQETSDFDGALRELRVWSCARTATEIKRACRYKVRGTEDGLVASWSFDADTGTALVNGKRNAPAGVYAGAWVRVPKLELDGVLPPRGTLVIIR